VGWFLFLVFDDLFSISSSSLSSSYNPNKTNNCKTISIQKPACFYYKIQSIKSSLSPTGPAQNESLQSERENVEKIVQNRQIDDGDLVLT